MIRYFNRNESNFNHNEKILSPLSCYITEQANGMFELEAEFARNVNITEGDIIKAPSPRGEQLFRIYCIKKSLKGKTAYAKHIFYDLSKNFLINVNLDNDSGFTAIQSILDNAETEHNFTATSDVLTLNSATYTRMNPVQVIIGDENSILNKWGGNLIRNNFNISIKVEGTDRGYEIRMGKNLIGIDADIDESNVKTRIYPIVTLSDNDTVYALPDKYVDSPLISHYGEPVIYTVEVKLTDEQKQLYSDEQLSMNDIYEIMRDYCSDLFETDNIDKPVINYKVNFVELSKTEQYKDLAILEQLDLYDIVTVNVSHLDINVKARCVKYKYDCLKERYESIELGDFSSVSSYSTDNIVKRLQSGIKASQSAAEYATNVITGNKGGYVVIRRYPDGKPYEFLVMDTEDINTAQNVFRLNNNGLGFSRNGYNGTYGTAMTIDGHIVADYIDTGTLTSILLKSDNYISNISGMQINLIDGTIDSKNFNVDSEGNIIANNANLSNGYFTGRITGGSMNINNKFIVDSNGNLTANDANIVNGSFSGNLNSASGNFIGNLSGGTINIGSGKFTVDTYGTLKSTSGDYTVKVENGKIYTIYDDYIKTYFDGQQIEIGSATDFGIVPNALMRGGYLLLSDGYTTGAKYLELNPISGRLKYSNGYNVFDLIHTGNIGSQTVGSASYASNAGSVGAGGNIGLFTLSGGGGYISYAGASKDNSSGYVYIGSQTLQAGTIEQISMREAKTSISSYDKNALDLICNTPIRSYTLKDNTEDTKTHIGVIVDEAPIDIIGSGGKTISLYDMISVSWKAIQEQQDIINNQNDRIKNLESRLSKLEVA
jgi:phage minor structural protein